MGQETFISPSITLTEKYESNPRFKTGEEDDWEAATTVSPRITFTRSYVKSDLKGTFGVDLEYYTSDTELNNERYNASLGLNVKHSTKTTFTFSERFILSQEFDFFEDETGDISTGVQVERNDILTNTISIGINYKLRKLTSIGIGVRNRIREFEKPDLIDSRIDTATISVDHDLSAKSSYRASYAFTLFDFDNKDSISSHGVILGFTHALTPNLSYNLSGGVFYTDESGFRYGFIGDTGLTRSTRRSRMSLRYSRKISTTSGLTSDISIRQGLSFNLTSKLTKTFSASLNAGINLNRSETSGRVDILSYNTRIRGSWRPYPWMVLETSYSHFQQEADGTVGEDLTRDTVFMRVKLVPAVLKF